MREQRVKLSSAQTFVDNFSAFCAERLLSSYLQALWRLLSKRLFLCTFVYQQPSERRPDTLPLFTCFVWAAPDWGWRMLSSRARICCRLVAAHGKFFIGLQCLH